MSVSRRKFMRSGATAALAAGALLKTFGLTALAQDGLRPNPRLDFQIPFRATQDSVFYFTRTTFEPYVGGAFRARTGLRAVNLTLAGVRERNPRHTKITRAARSSDCFSLLFRASGLLSELSPIKRVSHAALGNFDLFMTPSRDERGKIFYEAIINHTAT